MSLLLRILHCPTLHPIIGCHGVGVLLLQISFHSCIGRWWLHQLIQSAEATIVCWAGETMLFDV